jgi:hypothetical protein
MRVFRKVAQDEALANEFEMAVRELNTELRARRQEVGALRSELHMSLEAVLGETTLPRLERLKQQLTSRLGLSFAD